MPGIEKLYIILNIKQGDAADGVLSVVLLLCVAFGSYFVAFGSYFVLVMGKRLSKGSYS